MHIYYSPAIREKFFFKISMLGYGFWYNRIDFKIILVFDFDDVDGVFAPLCPGEAFPLPVNNDLLQYVDDKDIRIGMLLSAW